MFSNQLRYMWGDAHCNLCHCVAGQSWHHNTGNSTYLKRGAVLLSYQMSLNRPRLSVGPKPEPSPCRCQDRPYHCIETPHFHPALSVQVDLPSWLAYPDVERVGWLNTVVCQMWPHIARAVQAKLLTLLLPLPASMTTLNPDPDVITCDMMLPASKHSRHHTEFTDRPPAQALTSYRILQDSVAEQFEPMLRQNKPRWLGDVKLLRFTMGGKVPSSLLLYSRCQGQGRVGLCKRVWAMGGVSSPFISLLIQQIHWKGGARRGLLSKLGSMHTGVCQRAESCSPLHPTSIREDDGDLADAINPVACRLLKLWA